LQEKNRLEQVFNAQKQEMNELEGALEKLEFDVSRLQSKLNEAVARRDTMLLRQQTLCQQKQVKQQVNRPNLNSAFEKFEMFERKIDQMEAEVEAMSLGQNVSLKHQIDDLVVSEHIENELKALKQKVAKQ
jgi:phage shock protein A